MAAFVLVLVSSCSQKLARIEYKGEEKYGYYQKKDSKRKSNTHSQASRIIKDYVIVEPGDTLHTIAIKHNVLYKDIADINNLKWPYKLYVGQKLVIPKARVHQVQSGESLSSIAKTYNLQLNTLIELNKLEEPYMLHVGQVIKIAHPTKPEYIDERVVGDNVRVKQLPPLKVQKRDVASSKSRKIQIIKPAGIEFSWPVNGKVVSDFGQKGSGFKNDGIYIAAKEGSSIKSVAKGTVVYSGDELSGYGNLVIVKHNNQWLSAYAHMKSASVQKGDIIKQGQQVGTVGRTGNISSPQLHFALRHKKKPVNPMKFLPRRVNILSE
jgi:murein DD-endopeptidase MepM/ murein hydrolase activator NlpD